MMDINFLFTVAIMVMAAFPVSAHDAPEIVFVGSHYKTASGAIGPSGVLATHRYRIRVEGADTLIVDNIIAGRRSIVCEPVVLQSDGKTLEFSVSIAFHQTKVSSGRIIVNDRVISQCRIRELGRSDRDASEPDLIVYAHNGRTSFTLIREKLDSESSQYNK